MGATEAIQVAKFATWLPSIASPPILQPKLDVPSAKAFEREPTGNGGC